MKIPRKYQLTAIARMKDHNTYLCDSCGLGKTLTSILALAEVGYSHANNLIICRKSARLQWKREIEDLIPNVRVELTNHLPWKFKEHKAWWITHYDELTSKSLLYPIGNVVWDGIIIDEAHKLRTHNISRTKNIININGARKIALSATPIEKSGGDLWGVLRWLDSSHFPAYWSWVYKMFDVQKGYYGGYEIGEPLNMKVYQDEIRPYMIRRTKEQVAPELPPRVDIVVPVLMEPSQFELYTLVQEERDVLIHIEDKELLITNALTLFTRLHQIAVAPSILGLNAPSAKLMWLNEFVEDHPNMRLLVFSRYRAVVDLVKEKFARYGVFVATRGEDQASRFQAGEGRMLAGTIDYMSESLSLEMADAAIFLDQHWSSTQMQQAVDRIHRMNITSAKFVYYLTAADVDNRVMKVVAGKKDDQEMLLDFIYNRSEH